MFQDATILVKDTIFVPLYLQKNPQDISADTTNSIDFDHYVVNILKDSFPAQKTRESLFIDKPYCPKNVIMQKREINENNNWIFSFLILIIFLFALMIKFSSSNLIEIIRGCFSRSQVSLTVKEGTKIFYFSFLPILFVFLPIISFLIYCFSTYYNFYLPAPYNFKGYFWYLIILIVIVIYYFLKLFFIRFFGSVFRGKKISIFYTQIQLNFNFLMGFLLIIPVIFAIYVGGFYEEIFLFISLFIFVILYVMKIIRSFFVIIKTFKFSHFYLFFYLCIVELLPILLIGKVLFF